MNTLLRLEKCLLPPPEVVRWHHGKLLVEQYSFIQKIGYCVKNFFTFTVLLIFAPVSICYDLLQKNEIVPLKNPPMISQWPPAQRGFATSLFQTSGLGTKWSAPPLLGKCDWDKWMDHPKHISHSEGFDFNNFFTDILSNPDPYIDMLKKHNVTAHRFSLEWSVICPAAHEFDIDAICLYQNFIKKLIHAGITPSITLSHFALPEWFYASGSFHNETNIHHYVDFALAAMKLFPEVKDWWSFNELGIRAFQQTREVHPTDLPEGSDLSSRIHAAGISTRNMLIAHCLLHKQVAALYPDKKLGVTHQWLKFDTATGNPLETLAAYYLTKFAFTPVYQFFKEGRFSFEFPFIANIQFEISSDEFSTNDHFLMRLGVQAYPKPMLKISLSSCGASCEEGGTVMRFGPRWHADAISEILDEAFAITPNVFVTEFGSDAMIQKWGQPNFALDDAAQAEYLQSILQQIQQYPKPIQGLFCWSDLRRQLEWENGFNCRLGLIEPIVDTFRRLISHTQLSAAQCLAQSYSQIC